MTMEPILVDPEERIVSVKITVMNPEDKDTVIKNVILFNVKCHQAYDFTEISPDTLYAVCFN